MSILRSNRHRRKAVIGAAIVAMASLVAADEGTTARIRFVDRSSKSATVTRFDKSDIERTSQPPPIVNEFEIQNPAEIRRDQSGPMKLDLPAQDSASTRTRTSSKVQANVLEQASQPVVARNASRREDEYVSRLETDVAVLSEEVRRLAQSLSTSKIGSPRATRIDSGFRKKSVAPNILTVSDKQGELTLAPVKTSELPPIVDARVRPAQAQFADPGFSSSTVPSADSLLTPNNAPTASTGGPMFFGSTMGIEQTIDIFQGVAVPGATFALDLYLKNISASNGQDRGNAADIGIRGTHPSQINGGSHWIAARADLDTRFGKIDPHLVERVTVTKGPYNVMEGPGFAFFDIELLQAPRYCNGYESHGQTIVNFETNGSQLYGRQSLWGGSSNWGYRIGYAQAVGSDYEAGNGEKFVSSYEARLPDVALSADLTRNSRVDFHYFRSDQKDVEFAGQVFDLDDIVTDAYAVNYQLRDQPIADQISVETWYNRTGIRGPAKRIVDVGNSNDQRIDQGNVDASAFSTGYIASATWGDKRHYLTTGTDFRYVNQRLDEIVDIEGIAGQRFLIPASDQVNPGLFVEGKVCPNERLSFRSGARVDWISSNASTSTENIDVGSESLASEFFVRTFDQHFTTWSAFLAIDQKLDSGWTLSTAAGHAMRPPSMTELYSFEPFLAVLPQFQFMRPRGNPSLDAERLWQLDVGLNYESQHIRYGVNGYYSWILDYITFDASPSVTPTNRDAVPFEFTWVNTPLATISGGDAYCEIDWNRWLTSFARVNYVEGRDHTRETSNSPIRSTQIDNLAQTTRSFVDSDSDSSTSEEPLPAIAPIESQIGIRATPMSVPNLSFMFSARIVDNQDRVATTLFELPTPGFTTYDLHCLWSASDRVVLTCGLTNLTNKQYQEHFDPRRFALVSQPGRSFHFGGEFNY